MQTHSNILDKTETDLCIIEIFIEKFNDTKNANVQTENFQNNRHADINFNQEHEHPFY